MNVFLILSYWLTDPHLSLTTSGQSFVQQPFRFTGFSWTILSVVYILNILNIPELFHNKDFPYTEAIVILNHNNYVQFHMFNVCFPV
jgi:hypothetical protein